MRPLNGKALGTVGELSASNPGVEVPAVAPEGALNVSARGADDSGMGDEVAQREITDAESSAATKSENRDAGTARRIQRPEKLKITC